MVFHALLHVADSVEWLGPMWSYSQWVMERTCGLWSHRVKQKSQYTDRHLSLMILHDTQIYALKHSIRLDVLSDQNSSAILEWVARHVDSEENGMLEDGVSRTKYADKGHCSTLHTPAGRIQLTFNEVKALADMFDTYDVQIPTELNDVLAVIRRRPNTILSHPTAIKVTAYKHLLTNDRQVEQALFNAYIRGKRFEPPVSRDATFARLDSGTDIDRQAYFGRLDFFFIYEFQEDPNDPATKQTLMLACVEPLRACKVERNLCRIKGGDPLQTTKPRAVAAVKILTSAHPSGLDRQRSSSVFALLRRRSLAPWPSVLSTPGNAAPASRDAPVASLCSALGLTLG